MSSTRSQRPCSATGRHTGIRSFVAASVLLDAGQVRRVDVPLQVGSTAETITVEAGAALIQTDSGTIGGDLDTIELFSLLGETNGFIAGALAGGGRKRLGVVSDEVFLDPSGARGLEGEVEEFLFGGGDELFGVGNGGF